MKNNDSYKVYMHTNRFNNKKYIGITCQKVSQRWRNGNGYKKGAFANAIAKYGWDAFIHEILFTDLTEKQAKEKEIELIDKYKTNNKKYGYNMTEGGDGTRGYKLSEETKRKVTHKGKNFKHSEETKRRMSAVRTGKKHKEISKIKIGIAHKGMKLSDECKRKISETKSTPILMYDLHGNFIKEFKTCLEASNELGVHKDSIRKCCRGKYKQSAGYVFKYKNEVNK